MITDLQALPVHFYDKFSLQDTGSITLGKMCFTQKSVSNIAGEKTP